VIEALSDAAGGDEYLERVNEDILPIEKRSCSHARLYSKESQSVENNHIEEIFGSFV
jgi:hypothetical protein